MYHIPNQDFTQLARQRTVDEFLCVLKLCSSKGQAANK